MEFSFNTAQNKRKSGIFSKKSNIAHSYHSRLKGSAANAMGSSRTSASAAGSNLGPNIVGVGESRTSLGKAGANEFVMGEQTSRRRAQTKPNYAPTTTKKRAVKRKTASKAKSQSTPLSKKAFWAVLTFAFLRLIFMDNGVIDYYDMEKTLGHKSAEYISVVEENNLLVEEIKRIKIDQRYQKKLARDHLGVIARDEYLVLFAGQR